MRNEVIKHSAAIQISNRLTLLQRRLFNILLGNAYAELPYADTHSLSADDICQTLGYESKNIRHLKSSLKGLMTTVVEWNILGKDDGVEEWQASTLLANAGLTNGVFTYSYSPYLREKLYNPEYYAKISLSLQNNFKSTHSLALYELLLDFYDHRKPISRSRYITILEFRKLLGIASGMYKEFKVLKRDIISKALDEINDISDIHAEIIFKRVGRSIGKMQFIIKRNPKNASQVNALPVGKQHLLPELGLDISNQDLLKRLVDDYGVELKSAVNLLEKYDRFQIEENLIVVEQAAKSGRISQSVAGFVVQAIKGNWTPNTSATNVQESVKKKKELAQTLQAKEEKRRVDLFKKESVTIIEKYSVLPSQEKEQILSDFENYLHPTICRTFLESERDITSPVYIGDFCQFAKENKIAHLMS